MGQIAVYKDTDTTGLTGQLLYAVSADDEVAPAKVLAEFAKKHGALSEDEIKALASMPSKNELIAQVVAQLLSPVTDSVSGLSGGLSGIVSGLEAHTK